MKSAVRDFLKEKRNNIVYSKARKTIENKDFTIISNNCWGGHVYQDLKIGYNSPFVGLFLHISCYVKLLQNLEYYMKQELIFVETSKYATANRQRSKGYYPIALLDDVELHMLHYADEEEARTKWSRRKERMNWDNLFIKMSAPKHVEVSLIEDFDKLPYENKVIFSEKDHEGIENLILFKDYSINREMNHYSKYFDFVKWLNEGKLVSK